MKCVLNLLVFLYIFSSSIAWAMVAKPVYSRSDDGIELLTMEYMVGLGSTYSQSFVFDDVGGSTAVINKLPVNGVLTVSLPRIIYPGNVNKLEVTVSFENLSVYPDAIGPIGLDEGTLSLTVFEESYRTGVVSASFYDDGELHYGGNAEFNTLNGSSSLGICPECAYEFELNLAYLKYMGSPGYGFLEYDNYEDKPYLLRYSDVNPFDGSGNDYELVVSQVPLSTSLVFYITGLLGLRMFRGRGSS